MYNTSISGSSFTEATVQAVWNKGKIVPGENPNLVRRDMCGALMWRNEYGNTNSRYGWEIDHMQPKSKGGSDALSNLQPLQWQNNRSKGNNFPRFSCAVKAA